MNTKQTILSHFTKENRVCRILRHITNNCKPCNSWSHAVNTKQTILSHFTKENRVRRILRHTPIFEGTLPIGTPLNNTSS